MKRAKLITDIVAHHRQKGDNLDINQLTNLSIKELRDEMDKIINPPQPQPQQQQPQTIEEETEEDETEEEEEEKEEVKIQPKKKLINLRPQKKVLIQEKSKYKKSTPIEIEPPKRQTKRNTEEDEDYDYIMYIITNYNKDIHHLVSLFDKNNMNIDDKDKLYDAYCVYRDNLDEDLDSFELDKQLKSHLNSVINRNRCIIQRYI